MDCGDTHDVVVALVDLRLCLLAPLPLPLGDPADERPQGVDLVGSEVHCALDDQPQVGRALPAVRVQQPRLHQEALADDQVDEGGYAVVRLLVVEGS